MKYEKKECGYCVDGVQYKLGSSNLTEATSCCKCNGLGHMMIAERPATNKLISNRPAGGQTPDMNTRSFL